MKRTESEIEAIFRDVSRHGLGGLNPTEAQLRALLAYDVDEPLHFVNLLAYHDVARYPAGHEMEAKGLTGAEAYALYGSVAARHVVKRGGRLIALNHVVQSIIGAGGEWHQTAVMEYPNTAAFLDMIRDPDYTAALVHRDAGLARTEVIVTRSLILAGSR